MATSGTATFTPDLSEVIEEAYEQAGLEVRSGYDVRSARRSLNLLALDWANRGYNLWTIEQREVALTQGVAQYPLPTDTIDVMEMVIRTISGNQTSDVSIARVGMATFAAIPSKQNTGRPVQAWIDRQAQPILNLWPIPDNNTYTFVYWRMRRIQDTGNSGQLTLDIPARFYPCLISGLAYKIGLKKNVPLDRLATLKTEYEQAWQAAADEDRERVAFTMTPKVWSVT